MVFSTTSDVEPLLARIAIDTAQHALYDPTGNNG